MVIKVFVADDHNLVRKGICALLKQQANVEIVGEAADGRAAVKQIKTLLPHIALMDISMPSLDGIQATEQIVAAGLETRVIVLSMHDKPNIVKKVLRVGARGYLLKNSLSEELPLAIHAAVNNHVYLSPKISSLVLQDMLLMAENSDSSGPANQLTAREQEVLQLVSEGHTNKDIADILVISERTVEKHRANVMKKLNVSDLPTLINEAIKRNLVFIE